MLGVLLLCTTAGHGAEAATCAHQLSMSYTVCWQQSYKSQDPHDGAFDAAAAPSHMASHMAYGSWLST
jgi:hypothetical protein